MKKLKDWKKKNTPVLCFGNNWHHDGSEIVYYILPLLESSIRNIIHLVCYSAKNSIFFLFSGFANATYSFFNMPLSDIADEDTENYSRRQVVSTFDSTIIH